ncbi:tyrosine-type recombinase/integrase [Halomonas sp. SCS19]|uniref:tyrosine-type recombinase/integrase n=1 Tax=Halomonas sp. SCS19 TaxID=2950870 RepID=UPI0032DFBC7B
MVDFTLKRKITETAIKHARHKGIRTIYDTAISGFICTLYNRDVTTFSFRYRSKLTGRRPTVKIGRYPTVSVDEARDIARKMAVGLSQGVEPRLVEQAAKEAQQRREEQWRREDATIIETFLDTVYRPHKERMKRGNEDLDRLDRHFKSWYRKRMTEITKSDVTRWHHALESKGLAFLTIKRSFDVLQGMLNMAVEEQFIDQNPIKGVRLRKPVAQDDHGVDIIKSRRALTEEEVESLFRGLERYTRDRKDMRRRSREKKSNRHLPDWDYVTYVDYVVPAILVIYYAGLRPGDVYGLRWENVDLDLGTITKVIEKTAHHSTRPSSFPMADRLVDALRVWWQENGRPKTGYVFPSQRTGRRLSAGALGRRPWPLIKKLGGLDPDLDLYTLRHNFASQLILSGADLMTVMKLMGHRDIATTIDHYGHLTADHLRTALVALSDPVG